LETDVAVRRLPKSGKADTARLEMSGDEVEKCGGRAIKQSCSPRDFDHTNCLANASATFKQIHRGSGE
jgi:hypothetical protein